jgi:hypothetical protein
MSDKEPLTQKRTLQDMLQHSPPADWVRQMIEHHHRTGAYRSQDLRRLLGDQTRGVEVGPNSSLATHMSEFRRTS